MRIAIDIDSTLHDYWDQLAAAARRRFGVDAPVRGRSSRGRSRCCAPSRSRGCVQRDPRRGARPGRRALSGRRRGRPRLARGRPLHPHHLAPRHDCPRRATARWLDRIGLPYDELYCSFDKVTHCAEIGIDVLIDDSPVNLESALDAGMRAATLLHPWNREICETEDVICAEDWPGWRAALAPVLAMTRAPRAAAAPRQPRPARPPAGDRARAHDHRLGALASASRGCSTARVYVPLPLLVPLRGRGDRERPATGGALLVSNHAGALPPDASMIAKAIQEEHPRPRPLHLTVEHFFKGYPVLQHVRRQARRRARASRRTCTACCTTSSSSCSSSRRARKATEKLYKDRYRLRRFGRGGFVEAAMRAGVPIVPVAVVGAEEAMPTFAQIGLLKRLTGPHLLPRHAAVPALRAARRRATCRPSSASASSSRCARTTGRAPWEDNGPGAGRRRGHPRPHPGRAHRHARAPPLGVARDERLMRVLITGLSTYWGGRLAQDARARPRRRGDRRRLARATRRASSTRTEYVRVGTQHALLRADRRRPPRSTR